jgi:hypothetical protein
MNKKVLEESGRYGDWDLPVSRNEQRIGGQLTTRSSGSTR